MIKGIDHTKEANEFVKDADAYELMIRGSVGNFGVKLKTGTNEETIIGYDSTRNEIYVDRIKSGRLTDNPKFAARTTAPLLSKCQLAKKLQDRN